MRQKPRKPNRKRSRAARVKRNARAESNPTFTEVSVIEITGDALGDEATDGALKLPPSVQASLKKLYQMVHDRPREAIPQLTSLLEQYPDTPVLYNYLSVCHSRLGDSEQAEQVIEKNYLTHPHYLFARCNWATVLIDRGRASDVPAVFGNTWDLKRMYPHRKRFHISEFSAFQAVVVRYRIAVGDLDMALRSLEALEEIEPDSPMVESLRKEATFAQVTDAMKRLLADSRTSKARRPTRQGAKKS